MTERAPSVLATPIGETFAILGVEFVLAGGIAVTSSLAVSPRAVLGLYALLAAVSLVVRAPSGQSTGNLAGKALAPTCVSFLAALPGVLFFIEVMCRNGPDACYDRPMLAISMLWILVGPVLLFVSFRRARRWFRPVLAVVWTVHLVTWLAGAVFAWGCAGMV
jgi:hypothetical protein